jgi:hypothetical protein
MPTAGTLAHLKYISEINIPAHFEESMLRDFFQKTKITKSLAIFIKQMRNTRPVTSPDITFNSRVDLDYPGLPDFRGTLYRDPLNPAASHINVNVSHTYNAPKSYSYDFFIPINFDLTHDPSRFSQAYYLYDGGENLLRRKDIYNAMSNSEYPERDPKILVKAVTEASGDLLSIMNYWYFNEEPQTTGEDIEIEAKYDSDAVPESRLKAAGAVAMVGGLLFTGGFFTAKKVAEAKQGGHL